jgi:hypothetical protein
MEMKIIFQHARPASRFGPAMGNRYEAKCPKCGLLISLRAEKTMAKYTGEQRFSVFSPGGPRVETASVDTLEDMKKLCAGHICAG